MKNFDVKQYILPFYLLLVIFLQVNLKVQNILLVIIPFILIIVSIYHKNKNIGIIGIFLFYIMSLSPVIINNMQDYILILLEIIFLIIPSLLLLYQILQIENKQIIWFSMNKKPLITGMLVFIIIISIFYTISFLSFEGLLLTSESISGQILMLAGLSIVICLPFIVLSKE